MEDKNLNKEQVIKLLADMESELIERTISINNTDKYAEAICAFSNDLPNYAKEGYLLIGVDDKGNLSGFKSDDKFLQTLGGLRSDGNILPQPIISVESFTFAEGDVVVLKISPSPFPPVRYKGRTWIRVGPRKAIASEMEERILIERRSANISTFDIRPCIDADFSDLNSDLFKIDYLPNAIDNHELSNDKRDIKEQLAALRFYNLALNKPTNAGILLLGKNPEYFIPGAYIQYVRFKGNKISDDIMNEKKFSGNLITMLKKLDAFIDNAIVMSRPVPDSTLRETTTKNYPNWALRELLMNAVMHRNYESNAPVKFYQFDNRIELSNAGGLFGKARPENFPNENDYRNPVLAEAMKVLGYVNRFNRGIIRVKQELKENNNPSPVFDIKHVLSFGVTVHDASPLTDFTDENANDAFEKKLLTFGRNSEEIRKKFGLTALEILKVIMEQPDSTAQIMAKRIKVSSRTIEKNMAKLKEEGIIIRTGSTKKGYWEIQKLIMK